MDQNRIGCPTERQKKMVWTWSEHQKWPESVSPRIFKPFWPGPYFKRVEYQAASPNQHAAGKPAGIIGWQGPLPSLPPQKAGSVQGYLLLKMFACVLSLAPAKHVRTQLLAPKSGNGPSKVDDILGTDMSQPGDQWTVAMSFSGSSTAGGSNMVQNSRITWVSCAESEKLAGHWLGFPGEIYRKPVLCSE